MPASSMIRSYVGVTVTLAAANTSYNLKSLVAAALQAEGAGNLMEAPGACRSVLIQNDPANTGSNGAMVFVGDALVSSTRRGFVLVPSASREYSSSHPNVLLGQLWVRGTDAGLKLNVEIMAA